VASYASDVPGYCRCFRCGELLDTTTVTVDRIIPGCQGGTYRRDNIRPACGGCNSETGGRTRRTTRVTLALVG
jgi:5-methylcytosine-specific restriction endonuclease McrA